nr:MAG TPA: hypothetical protein [Bacteriophage sp.]
MKLNKNDRIKYDDSIYAVAAVIWSTVYLCAIDDNTTNYDCEINEVYKTYRDIEFLGKKVS